MQYNLLVEQRDLQPGDLVVGQTTTSIQQDVGITMRFGLVIGVDYKKQAYHSGCEDRVRVMWSQPIRFETVCSCGLVLAETLVLAPEEKCVAGEKSVKQVAASG